MSVVVKSKTVHLLVTVLTLISLWGCGQTSSQVGSPQMGGAIQGKSLVLNGTLSTLAGPALTDPEVDLSGVATDGRNLYVTDRTSNTIDKIVIASGEMTVLAGSAGKSGSSDGIGAAARFSWPGDVATDGTNLYVPDCYNNTIRKVVIATGEVTTLAGTAGVIGASDGRGPAASFNYLRHIVTDGENLFVTDADAIRKIVIATGEVTTLAGSVWTAGYTDGTGTAARFSNPQGIATDATSVFVADAGNQTIRRIDKATGKVTTLAGTVGNWGSKDGTGPAATFAALQGMATDGRSLFVADGGSSAIRRVDIATAAVTTLAGNVDLPAGAADGMGSSARFNWPLAVATDGTNLYVADSNGGAIRKVVIATGAVTTINAASGWIGSADGTASSARFDDIESMTTDGTSLYVADTGNGTIRKVDIATGAVMTLAGSAATPAGRRDGTGASAAFNSPRGITTDGTDLYVADSLNGVIRKVNKITGSVSTLSTTAQLYYPTAITTDGTYLYVTDVSAIRVISIATGDTSTLAGEIGTIGSTDGAGGNARFCYPSGITTDGTNLYVTDSGNSTIRKVVIATGAVTTLAGKTGSASSVDGTGSSALFNEPAGVTTDGTNLYVADRGNYNVRKIVLASGAVTTLGSLDGKAAAAITTDGKRLFVSCIANNIGVLD